MHAGLGNSVGLKVQFACYIEFSMFSFPCLELKSILQSRAASFREENVMRSKQIIDCIVCMAGAGSIHGTAFFLLFKLICDIVKPSQRCASAGCACAFSILAAKCRENYFQHAKRFYFHSLFFDVRVYCKCTVQLDDWTAARK